MPSKLALPSLEIQNYRGIRELKIERLGRANLITGKNNVGKTSVLEAIRLYARPADLSVLLDIMYSRHEFGRRTSGNMNVRVPIESLMYGRPKPLETLPIKIGRNLSSDDTLTIDIKYQEASENQTADSTTHLPRSNLSEIHENIEYRYGSFHRWHSSQYQDMPSLKNMRISREEEHHYKSLIYITQEGLDEGQVSLLWDKLTLTPLEEEAIRAMAIVLPGVERIAFKLFEDRAQSRIAFVRINGQESPVPLKSLGDGVGRLFGIAVAFANARGGFMLIDEIENGIHYSVQADLWRFIFRLATQLDVQVFATTHSWDMVKAFQLAASESDEEGVLIRLQQGREGIHVTEFDEEELEIVAEKMIEVR